jgi:threonine/homoserine/homoserine lactone efflux protein
MLVNNMGLVFGVLADTVEVLVSILMMVGGIALTWAIQKWADKTGEKQPGAANLGKGGGPNQYEQRTIRR